MTKQPFPDVVKACGKLLARLFFATDNFVRTRIVAAFRQSSRHLQVGTQAVDDDILLPIVRVVRSSSYLFFFFFFSLSLPLSLSPSSHTPESQQQLDSNDPVARGLTLQALAYLSCLLVSRHDIQFRILERLDATQASEALAALLAVERVMLLSDSFTEALVRRASVLLESANSGATSTVFKLALIRVLGACGGGPVVSGKVRELLGSVLVQCPAEAFVTRTLESLTQLTLRSFSGAEQHIETLFRWIQTDNRPLVQIVALRGLASLVRKSPIHLQHHASQVLALIAGYPLSSLGQEKVLAGLLAVLAFLGRHWSVAKSAIDSRPVAALLSHSSSLVRRWALRAMGRAAAAFPASAQQLGDYCLARLKEAPRDAMHADFARGSEFLRVCLSLMRSTLWASRIFLALLESAKGCSALMHSISVGAMCFGHCLDAPCLTKASKELANFAQQSVSAADGELYCGTMLTYLRLRGSLADSTVLGSFNAAMASHAAQLPGWRVTFYRVAREAMHVNQCAFAASVWLLLTKYVETEEYGKWLMALYEICQGESELQKRRLSECCRHWRRASTLIAACTGQSINVVQPSDRSAQAVSRNNVFRFQRLYVRWRIAFLEASPNREDVLRRLGQEARELAWSFADFDAATKQFFQDVQWCLATLDDGSSNGSSNSSSSSNSTIVQPRRMGPYYSSLSTHFCPLLEKEQQQLHHTKGAAIQDLLFGFRLASGGLPRYFFRSVPRISVDLSIVKPKQLESWNLAQWDLGHCLTVDGVIRSSFPMLRPKTVEITVSVLRTPDNKQATSATAVTAAQACRLLCYDQHGPDLSQISLVGNQVYQAKIISGESFSVPIMVVFPETPKSQYVLRFKVVIMDSDDNAYNLALSCVAFSMLWSGEGSATSLIAAVK